MATYLPTGWHGKRVAVLFNADGGSEGSLFNDSDGGVMVDIVED